jgi:hypothetical protein
MPACGQCGSENPENAVTCSHCGEALITSAAKTLSNPASTVQPLREIKVSQSKPAKPGFRLTPVAQPTPGQKVKSGVEWIPWSQLSPGQRMGRAGAYFIAFFLLYFLGRYVVQSVRGSGLRANSPVSESSQVALTEGDRRDGIESLCKVFQIYGIPKNDKDASEATHNAGELFKLAGNQAPDRSSFILTSVMKDFREGKLKAADCSQAGVPLSASDGNNDTPETPGAGASP